MAKIMVLLLVLCFTTMSPQLLVIWRTSVILVSHSVAEKMTLARIYLASRNTSQFVFDMQPLLGERSLWLLLNSRHCSRAKFKKALVVEFVVPSPAENRCLIRRYKLYLKSLISGVRRKTNTTLKSRNRTGAFEDNGGERP